MMQGSLKSGPVWPTYPVPFPCTSGPQARTLSP